MTPEEIRKAYDSIRNVLIDSPIVNGNLSRIYSLVHQLSLIYQQLLKEQHGNHNVSPAMIQKTQQESQEVVDCLHALKNIIPKISSKNDLIDTMTKHEKALEGLRQIEVRLQKINPAWIESIFGSLQSIGYQELLRYGQYLDIIYAIETLLYIRYFIEKTTDDALLENIGSIHILILYLNTQRIQYMKAIQCTHWPIEDCYMLSMKEIPALFPDMIHPDYDSHRKEYTHGLNRSYGISYRGLWSGHVIHMKKVPKKATFLKDEFGCIEAINLMHLNSQVLQDSPYLNTLLGVSWDAEHEHIYFISALSTHRSLYDVFSNPYLKTEHRVKFTALEKISILLDVTAGIAHLHKHGYLHGRLKDSNVLLCEGNRVKLSDFGLVPYLDSHVQGQQWGMLSIRFFAPEHVQSLYLAHLLSAVNGSKKDDYHAQELLKWFKEGQGHHGRLPLAMSLLATTTHYLPSFSIDVYSIGALGIVLLSEKQLFPNIELEEGVFQSLLQNHIPTLMANPPYPDKEDLIRIEEDILPITVTTHISHRPSASTLLSQLEEIYCDVYEHKLQTQQKSRQEDVTQVQREIYDLDQKIKDHVELIAKGKELIAKKEQEKLRIVDGKQRREHEIQVEKARKKFITFQEELEGLREDKDGAEHDLEHLKKLLADIEAEVKKGRRFGLENRCPYRSLTEVSQEDLFATYFTDRDVERFTTFLQNESARGGRLGSMTPSHSSPFTSYFDSIEQLSNTQLLQFQRLIQESSANNANNTSTSVIAGLHRGVYCKTYQYLFEQAESVFRVPIQAKALMPNSTPLAGSGKQQPHNIQYEDDDEDDIIVPNKSMSVPAPVMPVSTFNRVSAHVPQQIPAPSNPGASVSKYRLQTAPDSDDEDYYDSDEDRPAPKQQQQTNHSHNLPGPPSTIIEEEDNGEEDEDDYKHDSRYNLKERILSRATTTGTPSIFGGRLQGQTIGSILKNIDQYIIPLADPVSEGYDDFPVEDYDIVHVQYLAAARGNWEESVGMRRLQLGFSDEHVSILLEQQYTPIHLAAYLGNLVILRRLVEEAGLPVYTTDANGESALHAACKRGNLAVVKYLVEVCQLPGNQENAKGITPIQCALQGGYLDVVAYFMEHTPYNKISPHFTDSVLHATLLHWSCLGRRVDLVEYLVVQHTMAVDAVCPDDESTCLLWACYGSTCDVVKYLIEGALADPHVKTAQGWTCLHMATSSGDVDKTLYLLDTVRLKITDKDKNHKTPFDVATGAALAYLQERKKKGFVTGSIAEKNRKEGGKEGKQK